MAEAMEFEKGELVEVVIESKRKLVLKRHSAKLSTGEKEQKDAR